MKIMTKISWSTGDILYGRRRVQLSLNVGHTSARGMLLARIPSRADRSIKLRRHPLTKAMLNGGIVSPPDIIH